MPVAPVRRLKEQIAFLQASLTRLIVAQEAISRTLQLEQGLRLRAEAKLARRQPTTTMSAVPDLYVPATDFSDYASSNPDYALPGTQMDVEFEEIAAGLRARDARAALIQRDDGAIRNESVGLDQLTAAAKLGLATPTAWATGTAYLVGNQVFTNGHVYLCIVAHTSGVFATDLAAVKWLLLAAIDSTLATNGVVQRLLFVGQTAVTCTTALPVDSTYPQNTEGDDFDGAFAVSPRITKVYASSVIRVHFRAEVEIASIAANTTKTIAGAIFRGTTADAFASGYQKVRNYGAGSATLYPILEFHGEDANGGTGAFFYHIRCGTADATSCAVGPQNDMSGGVSGSNGNTFCVLEEILQ